MQHHQYQRRLVPGDGTQEHRLPAPPAEDCDVLGAQFADEQQLVCAEVIPAGFVADAVHESGPRSIFEPVRSTHFTRAVEECVVPTVIQILQYCCHGCRVRLLVPGEILS